jgi:hypothetical protein
MSRTKPLATNGLSVAGDVTGIAALGGLSSALEQLTQECDKIKAHKVCFISGRGEVGSTDTRQS